MQYLFVIIWSQYLKMSSFNTEIQSRRNIMLYIGVDLGTSAVKLLLMDEKW